jgi:NAD(P)-dependent dehydrogenase (short-subunit alcohol dehydrogenase family)
MPKRFNSAKDIPSLQGKVILVTGGNAGIGEATVRALAAHNPRCIYLCARRTSSGEQVIRTVQKQHPNATIDVLELDLSCFDSVKKCADTFNSRSDRLDILFLNAGVASTAPATTKDGYEQQFGGKIF